MTSVQRVADRLFGWFFRGFNRFFGRASGAYTAGVGRVLRVASVAIVLYVGLIGLTAAGFSRVPPGFVPTQDKEYLVAFAQLPDGATLDRTDAVIRKMSSIALEHPGVLSSVAFPGLSINGFVNASNAGIAFVVLKPAEERTSRDLCGGRDRAGPERAVLRRDSGGHRRDLPAAVGAGARTGRWLQALRGGPGGHRIRGPLRATAERHRRRRRSSRRWPGSSRASR